MVAILAVGAAVGFKDVERLADVSNDLRQRHIDRRLYEVGATDQERRIAEDDWTLNEKSWHRIKKCAV